MGYGNVVCMKTIDRTTLNIDRNALARVATLTGVTEKTALVRMGLEALIAKASAERPASPRDLLDGPRGHLRLGATPEARRTAVNRLPAFPIKARDAT